MRLNYYHLDHYQHHYPGDRYPPSIAITRTVTSNIATIGTVTSHRIQHKNRWKNPVKLVIEKVNKIKQILKPIIYHSFFFVERILYSKLLLNFYKLMKMDHLLIKITRIYFKPIYPWNYFIWYYNIFKLYLNLSFQTLNGREDF